ncbi:MAG: hypothetical protein ACE5G0_05725 [Rhodothermales bacterium]
MSNTILEEAASLAREAAVGAAWAQWSSLGAGTVTTGAKAPESIIDPEALILVSLAMLHEERRLGDLLAWWARVGSRLLSVQRIKTMADRFPASVGERLGRFARTAAAANDARWKRYAGKVPLAARDKSARAPSLSEPPALILRLRAGFGVNAKADVLAFLLSTGGDRATIQHIVRGTGYASVTVREVTRDMALGRFIRETSTHPVSYYARPKPWAELLELDGLGKHQDQEPVLPRWRFWVPVFAFLAHVDYLAQSEVTGAGPYLQSSRARDIYEAHRRAFTDNCIEVPDPDHYRGAAYLPAFLETVRIVSAWVEYNL